MNGKLQVQTEVIEFGKQKFAGLMYYVLFQYQNIRI